MTENQNTQTSATEQGHLSQADAKMLAQELLSQQAAEKEANRPINKLKQAGSSVGRKFEDATEAPSGSIIGVIKWIITAISELIKGLNEALRARRATRDYEKDNE